ncbi:Signal transduction histidine kinase [Nannocystis exedens]|uniref:histidine kinase n=1 Tax=Nannocystis exedens TaxID=54 RepID=A0A1I2HSD0_9BACT|nr:HAMP domain-containing sensor histidine kinase [Nannocystis exedens]PCC69895.1 two-component sensor histidine kinase [Nannocystis exedens]SFF32642.1 Signal transduction histidine kinase [Nannocystis exedens]
MTRVLRGLSGRVFLAAAICAGLSVVVVAVVMTSLFIEQAIKRIGALAPQLDPISLRQCERDPIAYSAQHGPDLELHVYDGDTLAPAVPGAPPLDPQLLARLRAGEVTPTRMYFFDPWGGASLRRAADHGSCALIQLRWKLGVSERRSSLLIIFGLLAFSVALAVGLASFFAVRPIALRLEKLRRATEQVGRAAGYASAGDPARDDLGQLSALLDQAHARIAADAARMEARHRALEQHLANIAHDLRTPLASLQIALEQLAADARPADDPGLVRGAIGDVVYMGSLIDNLYLACRLQEGADPLHGDLRVDLCAVVDRVARRFAALGRTRGIEVHGARPDAPLWARCNPAMAEQALANLVHNAVAHGDPGGHVAILLEETDFRKGAFTLTVVDDGPGVPPADLPKIGERTFRSDEARRRDPKGGGLGLAISQEVCSRAGFTLTLAGEEPRGLRATIHGPVSGPPRAA